MNERSTLPRDAGPEKTTIHDDDDDDDDDSFIQDPGNLSRVYRYVYSALR